MGSPSRWRSDHWNLDPLVCQSVSVALRPTLQRGITAARLRRNLADVIDAALVLLADDGDQIITSDPDDLEPLAAASGHHVEIVRV